MKTKTMPGGGLSLSSDKLRNHRLQSTTESRWYAVFAPMLASKAGLQQLLKRTPVTRQAFAALPSLREITGAQNPETTQRGIFFGLDPLALSPAPEWRKPVDEEKDADRFHDSDSEDIYDLYNACNGIVRDGLLDVGQLDEFSPAEAQALNVPRLREIWEHTRAGCSACKKIIEALNIVRQAIKADKAESGANSGPALDVNHIDSIS